MKAATNTNFPRIALAGAALVALMASGCAKQSHLAANPSDAATSRDARETAKIQEVLVDARMQQQPERGQVLLDEEPRGCEAPEVRAFFASGSAVLDMLNRAVLDELARCLTTDAMADVNLQLIGRTDPRGSRVDNRYLAERRARTVAYYLMDKGVSLERMTTHGVIANRAEARRSKLAELRRVDVRITTQAASK